MVYLSLWVYCFSWCPSPVHRRRHRHHRCAIFWFDLQCWRYYCCCCFVSVMMMMLMMIWQDSLWWFSHHVSYCHRHLTNRIRTVICVSFSHSNLSYGLIFVPTFSVRAFDAPILLDSIETVDNRSVHNYCLYELIALDEPFQHRNIRHLRYNIQKHFVRVWIWILSFEKFWFQFIFMYILIVVCSKVVVVWMILLKILIFFVTGDLVELDLIFNLIRRKQKYHSNKVMAVVVLSFFSLYVNVILSLF